MFDFFIRACLDHFCQLSACNLAAKAKQQLKSLSGPPVHFPRVSRWNGLFCPAVVQRFDLVIRLNHNSFETAKKRVVSSQNEHTKKKTKGFEIGRKPFKNLTALRTFCANQKRLGVRNAGDLDVSVGEDRQLVSAASDELNLVLPVALNNKAKPALQADAEKKSKRSHAKPLDEQHTDAVIDSIKQTTSASPFNDSRLVKSVLRDTFLQFIKKLRRHFCGVCNFYFDSLAFPYPPVVYVAINPKAVLQRLSPVDSVRQIVGIHQSRPEEQHQSATAAVEIPNVALLAGTIHCVGLGLIDRIEVM